MKNNNLTTTSKFMSLVLRHNPGLIGITLDAAGWVSLPELIAQAKAHGHHLSDALVREVTSSCNKQRFALSDDGQRIRANQGHSIEVNLELPPQVPPAHLFHGTARRALAAIEQQGLTKRNRHHVHLTTDLNVARSVGQRYGQVVLLKVNAACMHADGHVFYVSANGVWLTDAVPPAYLSEFPKE
jgi:putative RNA 2'-phosphotransferase